MKEKTQTNLGVGVLVGYGAFIGHSHVPMLEAFIFGLYMAFFMFCGLCVWDAIAALWE
jgi:hypothetical protein